MRIVCLRGWVFALLVAACWGQPNVASVLNGYSLAAGPIAPGELLLINGTNLATSTNSNCYSNNSFPTSCAGASVQIGGVPVPIIDAQPFQVAVYAPLELYSTGPVNLVVTTANVPSQAVSLGVVPASPAINATFLNAVNQVIAAGNPATPGSVVQAFATGLGLTNPQIGDGLPTPFSPAYLLAGSLTVYVGGIPAQVQFAGLSAGFVMDYQVNFVVPSGLVGNQPVVFAVDGVASPPVTLPIAAGTLSGITVTTASNLGTWPLGEIQLGLGATGGNGSFTWSVANGSTLPPGLALRPDLPAYITPFAPTGLIGLAATPGTYNFSLSIASGSATATSAFTLKITPLALQDGPVLPDGFMGTPYYGNGYQLHATVNGAGTPITCTTSTSNGVTLSSGCLISGAPTTAGPQTIAVTFTNGVDTVTQNLSFNVYAIQITSAGLLSNAPANAAYNKALAASGGAGPYSYTLLGALPSGLSLNAGVISGTPTASQGKYNFAVVATDSANHSYTKNMAIDITASPDALPQIAQYFDLDDCSIGAGCTRAIGVSGGGVAPFTWSVSGLPPGMTSRSGSGATLAYVSPGDLELYGAPTALGSYNVTVVVSDANGLSTTQIFPLKVSPLLVDTCTTTAGCQVMPTGSIGFVAYSAAFRLVGGTPPYTGALAPSRRVPDGLPVGLWVSSTAVTGSSFENGQFTPLFTFTDSAGTAGTLTTGLPLSINGENGSSTTIDYYPTEYTVLGSPYSLQLGTCCAASYNWIENGGASVPGVSLSTTGLLAGTPTQSNTYPLFVQATQSGNTNNFGARQVILVVSPISFPMAPSLPVAMVGASYSPQLAASGTIGSVSWSLGPGSLLPPGLALNATGQFSGKALYGGAYSFQVVASDSVGNLSASNFTIPVYTRCDVKETGVTTVVDIQQMINEAMGAATPVNDQNGDGAVNVVDLQVVTNSVLGKGCVG